MGGYEHREGQLVMADAVERALAEGRTLLCEAGTGTGKTLAYLVPAILSGLRVVVSTATKALQEQIIEKDLPLIQRTLGLAPEAALVKGLGNYVCRRRLGEARSAADLPLRSLPLVERWAETSATGDVAELASLAEGDPVLREITSSSETRIGAGCGYYDECFVTHMKRRAEAARLLVVNHHLFFADLAVKASMGRNAVRGGVLPSYDAVIFDEAHQIEDVAALFFGVRLTRARVEAMLRDAERAFVGAKLLTRGAEGEGVGRLIAIVHHTTAGLFERIGLEVLRGRSSAGRHDGRLADERVALSRELWTGALLEAYHAFDAALEALAAYAETHAASEAVRLVESRASLIRESAARIVEPATHHVTWAEATARSVAIGATPVEVGSILRDRVLDPVGSVVLASATLTTGGARGEPSFRFVRSRLGLDTAGTVPVDELAVPSPFDYARAALLYAPRDLPEVNDAEHADRAAERVRELVKITAGGAFVLCTSLRAMRGFTERLRGHVPGLLLSQGDAPKATLLARFRAAENAVLVATMGFWEGVDVPGHALRLVVIDKLPFAVPTDPVTRARSFALEEEGKSAFFEYSVPEAALALKQGFGRLIRTGSDRGIVAVLDRRLRTKPYGRALLAALPPAPQTEDLAEVGIFWALVQDDAMRQREA